MPEFRKICDVYQGYNYKKDVQTPVAFITKLEIGGVAFANDQRCKNPMRPTEAIDVVAVIADVTWQTGLTDAIYFMGQISTANKQDLVARLLDMHDVGVTFQFDVYEYDPVGKTWFRCFDCDGKDLAGVLEKRGEDLDLSVVDEPSTQVHPPENYAFNTGIKPAPRSQTLSIAVSSKGRIPKAWG